MNSPQSSPRPPRPEAATQRHRATPRVAYRRDTRSTLPVATTASDGSPNASAGRTDRRHHQGQSPPFAGSTASAAVRLARMTTALSLPLGRTARCRRADRPACQRVDQACCLRPRGIDVGSWVSAPAPVAVSASGKWSSACCCMCTSRRGCRGHRSKFGLCRGSNRWMSGVPSVRGKRRPGSRGAAPASRAWRARGRCGRGRWSAAADRVRPARSVLDLLTADYKFVDERLARRYGIPNAHGSRFRRVTRAGGRFGVAFVLARLRALDTAGVVLGRTSSLFRAALVAMSLQELAYQILAPPVQFPFEFALAHLPGFAGREEGFGIREDSIGRCARGSAREIDARDGGSRHVECTSLESCLEMASRKGTSVATRRGTPGDGSRSGNRRRLRTGTTPPGSFSASIGEHLLP